MLINFRNAMMAGKRLPYDAEVEYLESTGTQWIEDFSITVAKVEVDFQFTQDRKQQRIYSSLPSSSTAQTQTSLNIYESGSGYIATSSAGDFTSTGKIWNLRAHIILDGPNKQVVATFSDGTTVTQSKNAWNRVAGFKLMNGTSSVQLACAKLWMAKMWDAQENLLRDFIPVRKGTVGYIYDRVTRRLFGNAGTGAFTYGNDFRSPIPSE